MQSLKPCKAKDVYTLYSMLGGITVVAQAMAMNKSTISEHTRNGSVAVRHWPDLIKLARNKGYALTPENLMNITLNK